ncbi:MAG: hypothetical protein WC358_00040 [Ignavibacteria bacterium]|jgi:hypothetical protein
MLIKILEIKETEEEVRKDIPFIARVKNQFSNDTVIFFGDERPLDCSNVIKEEAEIKRLRKHTKSGAFKELRYVVFGDKELFNLLQEAYQNDAEIKANASLREEKLKMGLIRERMYDWFKSLKWYERLFYPLLKNKFSNIKF